LERRGRRVSRYAQITRIAIRNDAVFHDLTTRRVLVMEWLDGVSVRDADAIDELGVDRRELAEDPLRCMLQQMLVDAQYHADRHPGNVMVLRNGRLALVDFGAASRIDPLQKTAIRDVMVAVSQRDADLLRHSSCGSSSRSCTTA
jgi:ubiquinone biosynthesis protein